MKKIRRLLIKVVAVTLGLVLALLLTEGLATAYAWYQYGTIDVGELHDRETGNDYFAQIESRDRSWLETIDPHPYLAYVHNEKMSGDDERSSLRVNKRGFFRREYPDEKDDSKFTILVTGGSVAALMCIAGEGERNYLEDALNDNISIEKEAVVLCGACGSWSQPQEAISTLLHSDLVDIVVSLEGFNERHYFDGSKLRMEYPGSNFTSVNPIHKHGYEKLAVAWQTNGIKKWTRSVNSRSAFFLGVFTRRHLESSLPEDDGSNRLATIYRFPADWSEEKRAAHNLNQYRKYIKASDAISKASDADYICFVQPCPAIGKRLTTEEEKVVGDLSYRGTIESMTKGLLQLNDEGVRVVSLLRVFENTTDSVYSDRVHCLFGDVVSKEHEFVHTPSLGYRLISEAMAEHIAAAVGAESWEK